MTDGYSFERVKSHQIAVLVNSCDKYSHIWPIFFNLFFHYWPDCPFPVYLGSNEKNYPDDRVKMIHTGPDNGWAEMAKTMLQKVEEKYVLWFLEDFFLFKKVDTIAVLNYFKIFKKLNGVHIRFRPSPEPSRTVPGFPELGEYLPGCDYRCALDIAIWDKEKLLDLLKPGETPWEMEILGSRRTDHLNGFYASMRQVFVRTNGLERGKLLRYNLPLLKQEKIALPPGLPIMSLPEHYLRVLKNAWVYPAKKKIKNIMNSTNSLLK